MKSESIIEYVDPERALQKAVQSYGCSKVAEKLGISLKLLYAKLDPGQDRHTLQFREAIEISAMVDSTLPLRAWAHQVGGIFIELPDVDQITDDELLSRYAEMMKDVGAFSSEFYRDISDGKVTGPELQRMEKLLDDAVQMIEKVRRCLRKKAGR